MDTAAVISELRMFWFRNFNSLNCPDIYKQKGYINETLRKNTYHAHANKGILAAGVELFSEPKLHVSSKWLAMEDENCNPFTGSGPSQIINPLYQLD